MHFWNARDPLPMRSALVVAIVFLATIFAFSFFLTSGKSATTSATAMEAADTPDGTSVMVRAILSLAAILALIIASAFVFRRFSQRQRRAAGRQQLAVIGSIFLGPKKQIVLVRVLDRLLVLGVTDSSMTKLAELDHHEQQAAALDNGEEYLPRFDKPLAKWES